jgi:hypothetical protein
MMTRRVALALLMSGAARAVGAGQIRRQLLGVSPPADAFFDDTVLHDVRLTLAERDWDTLKRDFLGNEYYTTELRWRDQRVRNIGIRSRGTGSRSGTKPGLRVDLDRYVGGLRFLGLKSFVLRNNTQDPSNLHERISMLLFRRLGIPAPREAHARLFVNDDYVGLYTIVESVDKSFLQRVYGDDNGYLYDYDYPPNAAPYYFEDRGTNPARYVPLPFKPETHEDNPRPEVIVQLVQAINQSSAASFRSAMAEYLELDKFLRHVAVETYLTELDGVVGDYGMNNFFLHRYDNRSLCTLIPWDKSEAFKGNVDRGIFKNITDVPALRQNRLMARCLGYQDLVDAYLESLLACVRSAAEPEAAGGPGWLEREIEREYQQIRAAALADPVKPYSNDEFEASVEALRVFARQRGGFVVRQVDETRAAFAAARLAPRWPRRR